MATAVAGRVAPPPGLRRELAEAPPWSYPWRLGPGLIAPTGSVRTQGLQESRWAMIAPVARRHLLGDDPAAAYGEGSAPGGRALHARCGDGWFCHRLRELGAGYVLGIDAAQRSIRRARLVAARHAIGGHELQFIEAASTRIGQLGGFSAVLAFDLGPLARATRAFAEAARLTQGVAFLEGERAGASPAEIAELASRAGFRRVRVAQPPLPSDPSYVRRERLMLIAEEPGRPPEAPVELRP